MRKIVVLPLIILCALGASSACSLDNESPSASVTSEVRSSQGLSTATIDEARDAYNEALITGKLGSFIENGKAYFTLTSEDSSELGLIFPPGYFSSQDGKSLKWESNGSVLEIAKVGDLVEFGGGEAGGEDADAWDAQTVPSGGLWLAVPDKKN